MGAYRVRTALVCLALASNPGWAGDDLLAAIADGEALLDARYRFEHVAEDGRAKRADASTLRLRLGYTATWRDFSGLVELEHIEAIGRQRYNDRINGLTEFPLVGDAPSTEPNRYWIANTSLPETRIKLGRQKIDLGNRNWVASAKFRQNQQTYDSITATTTALADSTLAYAYVWLVDRTAGEDAVEGDFNSDSHLLDVGWTGWRYGKLGAFAHFIALDDRPDLSNRTLGGRIAGSAPLGPAVALVYTAELAWQTDYRANPTESSHLFALVEPGFRARGLTAKLGFRLLEGDGITALQTPIGAKHRNRGWVDKFSTTPEDGLIDRYGALDWIPTKPNWLGGTRVRAEYHDFIADNGGARYGDEIDLGVSYRFRDTVTLSLEYADYRARNFATDTRKFWASVALAF